MTKINAIKKVLEDNNGIASWEMIYNEIEKYYPDIMKSINWREGLRGVLYREEKNNRVFKKIGLGLIALIEYQEEKISEIENDPQRMHSYMEGICIEIGNFLKLKTFTADPSAKYNNLPLSAISTMYNLPHFTYPEIVDIAKKIDVLWFNEKGFQYPKRAIEIVNSINTLDAALKRTFQLMEFSLTFFIVCKNEHISKIEKALSYEPYKRFNNRYQIRNFDNILKLYNNPIAHQTDIFFRVD